VLLSQQAELVGGISLHRKISLMRRPPAKTKTKLHDAATRQAKMSASTLREERVQRAWEEPQQSEAGLNSSSNAIS
jgi:hypothetical protein